MSYDGLNSAIEEYNVALLSKYNFLKKGFPATGSMADKKKFKVIILQLTDIIEHVLINGLVRYRMVKGRMMI